MTPVIAQQLSTGPGHRFSISIVAAEPDVTERAAIAADAATFEVVYTGDIPSTHREVYTTLTLMALRTRRIALGPGVTNPVTRHPAVTAGAIASLDEISGGRAFLGLGTGDSAVHNIGERAATLAETGEYLDAIRSIHRTGTATYRSKNIVGRRWRELPVLVSAHGPKALQFAGRVADGVIAGAGMTAEATAWTREQVSIGAVAAGRDPADVDIWFMCYPSLGDEAVARSRVAAALAAGGNILAKSPARVTVPDRLRGALSDLAGRYDYTAHMDADTSSPNSRLIDELGLVDYLAERFGAIGPADAVVEQTRARAAHGVDHYWYIYSRPDIDDLITEWGRDVLIPLRAG